MKYNIYLSIFIYKPWFVGEVGLNMTVDNPVNFFLNKIEPNILFYIYIKVCFELSQMALSS